MGFSSGTTRIGPALSTSSVAEPPSRAESLPAPVVPPGEPLRCATTTELLEAFSAAFRRGDVDGIADCYTTPAIVISDDRSVVFGSRGEVMDGFRAVLARYWSSGVVPVGYSVEQEARLTANLREVVVEWRHRDSAHDVPFRELYRYLVRREGDGALRIHVAVVFGT